MSDLDVGRTSGHPDNNRVRYDSLAAEDDALVARRTCFARYVQASNASGAECWLHVYDSADLVADGATPSRTPIYMSDKGYGFLDFTDDDRARFQNGLYLCCSTTENTLTRITSASFLFEVR